ncbi:hypothetical protein J7E70_31805 [Variovorax paradoxus]|nr:hypothetical protein [Variovorax paradoxus]MBT2305003.1 hypothetical protein [Variovorax paradoxus]
MTTEIERPATLQINAWAESTANVDTLPAATPWAQKQKVAAGASRTLAAPRPADLRDWRHPEVGWGLVLPAQAGLSDAELSRADDAPPAIQRLLASRPGAPVLRWLPVLQQNFLRRYYVDAKAQDLSIAAPRTGIGKGQIPKYLLIYGSPTEIPWAVQYALNMSTFVGRLDLTGQGLERYVDALISNWAGTASRADSPLLWNVNHGTEDITWLMARAIGDRLWAELQTDTDLVGRFQLKDELATAQQLVAALQERSPALVVTTSHGCTGPLDDPTKMQQQLGSLVDAAHGLVGAKELSAWNPAGAIWYAHACCSAGSDQVSRYSGLLKTDTSIGKILDGVARGAGAMVAPLPAALLGAQSPLRAFAGHVEPTFDWTLREPAGRQVLTHVLTSALYNNLYQADRPTPIGFALRGVYAEAGAFFGAFQDAVAGINENVANMRDWALYRQLVASDRQTLVILGDPTVSLPSLRSSA